MGDLIKIIRYNSYWIILSLLFCLFSSLSAQNLFDGDYVMFQYMGSEWEKQTMVLEISADSAIYYRLEASITQTETDTVTFPYILAGDGQINFDNYINGILSADSRVFIAASVDSERSTFVIGIKKSSGLNDAVLYGD
jgi:hypothetical protein